MYKSVFTRYMVTIVAIVIISFSILATIISSSVNNLANERTLDKLYQTVDDVRTLLEVGFESFDGTLEEYLNSSREKLTSFISKIDREMKRVSAFITDSDGDILLSSAVFSREATGIDRTVLSTVFEEGEYREKGTLGQLLRDESYVSGLPIQKNGKNCGAVFVCALISYNDGLTSLMTRTVVLTSLWVMLVALTAVYFITRRTTVPLRNMSKAARRFAQGKFDVRVPVKGNDEVAQLAMAFNNMADSLESNEETRKVLLDNVSHDLRTPLFNISGFIENILSGAVPENEREKYLKIIQEEVRRLTRLVASLLDISRIQAGERKFFKHPFDICEMARQIIISFERKIEDRNLAVSFECEEDKMYVLADRDAIYQVLYNICDNAIKYSFRGGNFKVSISRKEKRVHVSVFNEGQGISKEDIPRVFGRFYKTDKSRGEDKSGLGLGLYIVKTIINAQDEEIWVNSEVGKNCEFVFTLTESSEKAYKAYRDESARAKQ